MNVEIKHRSTEKLLWSSGHNSIREAVKAAVKSGCDLSGADLCGADLRGADLRGADLRGAYLREAYLCGAYLRGAYLRGADLRGADLRGADLRGADFSGAVLSGADLRGAKHLPAAPIVPDLDRRILEKISDGEPRLGRGDGCRLEMASYHACATTHCRAGWAIRLAANEGAKLEDKFGPSVAGALIYAASRPGQRVPDFLANNEDALADIITCAQGAGGD